MTRKLWLVPCLALVGACGTGTKATDISAMPSNLHYVRDSRTNLCFAVLHNGGLGAWGIGLVNIPCTAEVLAAIADTGDGKKIPQIVVPGRREWPNTEPPDLLPAKRQRLTDKEVSEAQAVWQRWEDRRRDLWWALRMRVLTEEEMQEVRKFGDSLNIEPASSDGPLLVNSEQKSRELNDAFVHQEMMRDGCVTGRPIP